MTTPPPVQSHLFWCCSDNLGEMLGELFLAMETPEAPKQGFFKNLFSGGPSTLDREELCMYLHILSYILVGKGVISICLLTQNIISGWEKG